MRERLVVTLVSVTVGILVVFGVAFIFIRLLGANITGSEAKSKKVAGVE